MLFVHLGKRWNSRLQMFFKIAVLKNFACGSVGLHFIKKGTPTQAFSCEYCKIFKNSFFIGGIIPPVHYTFPKFCVIIEFFEQLLVQIWHFSYLLCQCFAFFHGYFVPVFIPKFVVSVTFACITTSPLALF